MQAHNHRLRQALLLALGTVAVGLCSGAPAAVAAARGVACPSWATPAPTAPGTGPAITPSGSPLLGSVSALIAATATSASGPASVTAVYSADGATFACSPVQMAQGAITLTLSGLQPSTAYQVWLAASDSTGVSVGAPLSLTTLTAGTVAQGVTAGSVRIGGKSRTAALTTLNRPFSAPVRFTYAGAYWHVEPSMLGVRTNAARLIASALMARPGQVLAPLTVSVDNRELLRYATTLSRRWSHAPAGAGVRLAGKHAIVVPARPGVQLKTAPLIAALKAQLQGGRRTLIRLAVQRTRAPAGTAPKAVVVRLGSQTLTAYLNGKAVLVTPVTTGRPALPTPIGSYSVQFRASPYVFHSPWPPGSPYWYPPTPVNWAMEFYDGDFLHDDPGEPSDAFGQDSQNGYFASHGCVHLPHDAMAFLYTWLPVGAPVIVAED